MNLDQLQNKLLRAARGTSSSDAVPYAFEQRIMHRLTSRQPESAAALWGSALWRGALACVALTMICGVWSYASRPAPADTAANFSQDFQATVFASMNQPGEGDW